MKFSPFLAFASLLGFVSCSTQSFPPAEIAAKDYDLVDKTAVIDVHTHTFNSSFLPIRGIALGKRDMNPFLSLFGDRTVIGVTDWISNITEKARKTHSFDVRDADPNSSLVKDAARTAKMATDSTPNGPAKLFPEKDEESLAKEISADPAVQGIKKIQHNRISSPQSREELTAAETERLKEIAGMFSGEGGLLGFKLPFRRFLPIPHSTKQELEHFFGCLTSSETQSVSIYQRDHEGKVSLMVSHMMDMAPSYNQKEDGKILVPIQRQANLMNKQQQSAGGKLLYFAAYNPFRDHWGSDFHPGKSLEIVKKAYEQQGAFGVKVYPPSGYAPYGNHIPSMPWTLARAPRTQWKARYLDPASGNKIAGEQIDREIYDLCKWCVQKDVPIFVHSGTNEVQAREGYFRFANPKGWKELLENHQDLRNLRLCFGHAGGESFWFGQGNRASWGECVYELCRTYPNIYCEFGAFDSITDPAKRSQFSDKLERLIISSREENGIDFSKKIIYGSDWFMPLSNSGSRVNYLRSFQVAILDLEISDRETAYKRFFLSNALNFLNPLKRLSRPGVPAALENNIRNLMNK